MNNETFLIIKKDFDNFENRNPIKEVILGYVNNECKAQSIVSELSENPTYKGWDNKDYTQFYYIKVEEYK